jgi:acyl carrier protein
VEGDSMSGGNLAMSTRMEIKEQLRDYVVQNFLPGASVVDLKDDTPLRTSGVLDSIATLKLVSYVEEQFGIEVEAHEASVQNFDTISAIAAFVEQKAA